MAVSLSRLKQQGQRQATSRKLAKEYAAQQARESKRSGWSSLLGGVGGSLLGGAIAGGLGIASGGLLMPLIMGASSTLGKKIAHEGTKGMGAKTGALVGDKYGYGGEEAKTLKEGLESQMRASDPFKQRGALGKDIAMSFLSAGMSGKLGGVSKALKGGEGATKGLLMGSTGDVVGTGSGLLQVGEEGFKFGNLGDVTGGFKSGLGEAIGLKETFGGEADEVIDTTTSIIPELELEPAVDIYGNPVSQDLPFQQGGQVPTEEELLMLLALAESQNQKAYDNTPLEEVKQPTISEYFGTQNKTLGGSNTKSLSQMLGIR